MHFDVMSSNLKTVFGLEFYLQCHKTLTPEKKAKSKNFIKQTHVSGAQSLNRKIVFGVNVQYDGTSH